MTPFLILPALGHMPFRNHRNCAEWGDQVDVDHFTDALAKHGSVARAAYSVGRDAAWGKRILASIMRDLGEAA